MSPDNHDWKHIGFWNGHLYECTTCKVHEYDSYGGLTYSLHKQPITAAEAVTCPPTLDKQALPL